MKKILITPLNWGLGHATRCIPIIHALIEHHFEPIIASDGDALTLLQKEFPQLKSYELPSYHISYSKGKNLKYALFLSVPSILKAVKKEKEFVKELVGKENLSGIISDNRFGVRNSKIPSVYITHQLNVLSGTTTAITSKLHQQIVAKFDECWIPDNKQHQLSGRLSKTEKSKLPIKFLGALSRFEKQELPKKYDLLIVLSGPEPQRTLLEQKLIKQLKEYDKEVLFVRGIFTDVKPLNVQQNITVKNYMLSTDLECAFNESKLVLARSGYSTILDLSKLEKKAFFIPTPGQFEQEYLAKRFKKQQIAPFASQDKFEIKMLQTVTDFSGFKKIENNVAQALFNLF